MAAPRSGTISSVGLTAEEISIASALLWKSEEYVLRRKVRIEMVDATWHRRYLTVDIELPEEIRQKARQAGLKSVPVPVSLSEKSPGRSASYDFSLEPGGAVQLPTAARCREMAAGIVSEAWRSIAPDAMADRSLEWIVEKVQCHEVSEADLLDLSELFLGNGVSVGSESIELPKGIKENARFAWLAQLLASRDVLYVNVPVEVHRCLCKLSFIDRHSRDADENSRFRASGLEAFRLRLRLAAWPYSPSHYEIEAPPDVELAWVEAGHIVEPESNTYRVERDARGARAHLYCAGPSFLEAGPAGVETEVGLEVNYRAGRRGFVTAARWITTSAAASVTTACVIALARAQVDGGAVTLLVAVPALAAPLAVQRAQHDLGQVLLQRLRGVLIGAACIALAAGLTLVLGRVDPHTGALGWVGDRVVAVVNLLPGSADFDLIWTDHVGPVARVVYWLALCVGAWWCALAAYAAAKLPTEPELEQRWRYELLRRLAAGGRGLVTDPTRRARRLVEAQDEPGAHKRRSGGAGPPGSSSDVA